MCVCAARRRRHPSREEAGAKQTARENRRHTGATRLMQITLAAARRARAYRLSQRQSVWGDREIGDQRVQQCTPPHTYQRAVKTAALHAPHTGAQGAREKKTETRKQAVLASRGGSLSAVQAARDHPTIRGEDAELSACYRSARDRAWSGGATATGHGPRGMELDGPCGCGRRSRSPGGRGRRRLALGGRGTCLSGACHQSCSKCRLRGHETQTRRTSRPACRARATPRDRGRGRTPRPKLQRGQARRRGVPPRGVHPAPRRPRLLLP